MTPASTSLHHIQHFFDQYAAALEAADAKRISSFYSLPCIMISDEQTTGFKDATAIEALYVQGLSFLKQHGIAHARPDVWSKRPWTERIVKTKVQWQYYNAQNEPLYACEYQYLLHYTRENAWKIEASVSVNERERLQEWIDRKGTESETGT